MAPTIEETQLLRAAIDGEPEAFGQLFVKYQPIVLRHAFYLTGDRCEAEDITAETFLRAWNAIGRYQDRGIPILSWLLRIAYNLRSQSLRGRLRLAKVEDLSYLVDDDPRNSPELMTESMLLPQPLRSAILKLPTVQRQVLLLRVLSDLSYDEIKVIVGKSAGAIRVIQHRALQALQRELEQGQFDEVRRRAGPAQEAASGMRAGVAAAAARLGKGMAGTR